MNKATNIQQILRFAVDRLAATSDSARIDAELLLAHALQKTRTWLYTHGDEIMTPSQQEQFETLITARHQGQPIAYLIGQREFWSMPFQVTPATLIPRPETELLVECCLTLLPEPGPKHVLDLGTGSGAIAIALAKERPEWTIQAIDISLDALKIAQFNAKNLNCTNILFLQSNWFESLGENQRFDLIVSNPPYIDSNDEHLTQGDIRFEPQQALVSDEQGLADLKWVIQHGHLFLKLGGLLLLEHGYNQKTEVASILKDYGYEDVRCWQDWQGCDRVSGGKLRAPQPN